MEVNNKTAKSKFPQNNHSVGASNLLGGEVDYIVILATLSDRYEYRLMVCTCIDAREAVVAWGQATRDLGGKNPVRGGCVETFKEREYGGLQYRSLRD